MNFISEYCSTDAVVVIINGNMTKEIDISVHFQEEMITLVRTIFQLVRCFLQCILSVFLCGCQNRNSESGVWGVGYLMFPTTAYENLIVDSQRISLLVPLNTRG